MPSRDDQALVDELVGNAHGNLSRVRELLDEHPELVNASASWDETPVQAASQMGNRALIELLLERGAGLDCYAAAALGRAAEVSRFLEAEPSLATGTGVHGLPALYFAAVGGEVEVARLMLRLGADVNSGAGGNTPLHGAAMIGRRQMAEWLLDQGADMDALDYEGKTPLERARAAGHADVADLLTERLSQSSG